MTFAVGAGNRAWEEAPGALHHLRATPKTVHWGYFDAALAPVLRVKSGDLIQAEAITHHAGDAPDLMMDEGVTAIFREIPEADRNPGVHIMTGPIYVEDARPGDMLEVRYLRDDAALQLRLQPRRQLGLPLQGVRREGARDDLCARRQRRATPRRSTPTISRASTWSPARSPTARPATASRRWRACACRRGRISARPASRPTSTGRVSTIPPGAHGGNIDNWRIGAGATMYYPVQVDGGAVLDRRSARQPGRRRDLRHGDRGLAERAVPDRRCGATSRFPGPLLETPKYWIVHGFDEDLNVAMRSAALDMLGLLTEHVGLSRNDAYSLMSVAADFAVTQVVDGRQGVHVRIPRGLFAATPTPDSTSERTSLSGGRRRPREASCRPPRQASEWRRRLPRWPTPDRRECQLRQRGWPLGHRRSNHLRRSYR